MSAPKHLPILPVDIPPGDKPVIATWRMSRSDIEFIYCLLPREGKDKFRQELGDILAADDAERTVD